MQQQVQWALQHLTDDQHEQKDTSVGRRERRRGPTERATAAERQRRGDVRGRTKMWGSAVLLERV